LRACLLTRMDAPDTSYYYHDHSDHDDAQNPDSRRCSVRGCLQPLPEGHQNKMCETCRGRHRIYASTKRAKRKLEKAAIANVAARNGANALILAHGNNLQNQPSASQQTWCALDTQYQVCAPHFAWVVEGFLERVFTLFMLVISVFLADAFSAVPMERIVFLGVI